MAKTLKSSQANKRARKTLKGGKSPARSSTSSSSKLTVARSVPTSAARSVPTSQLVRYGTDDYIRQKFADLKTDWSSGQLKQYFVKDGENIYHKIGVFHPIKFDAKKKIVDPVTEVHFVTYNIDPNLPRAMLGHSKGQIEIDMTKNIVYALEKPKSGGRRRTRQHRRHRRVTRRLV